MSFRKNIAFVLQNSQGRILICERSDFPGSWQFPQGGLKKGESLREGLAREVQEEIGLSPEDYEVVAETGPHRYSFASGKRKRGYRGQEQTYFLARSQTDNPLLDLGTNNPEFIAARWIQPEDFDLQWLPSMKQPIYSAVFLSFFNIQLAKA